MYPSFVAAAAARRLDQDTAGRPVAAVVPADPYIAGWLGRLGAAANSPRVESGQIVDAVPGGAAYLVDAGQQSTVWCSPGGTSGGFGAWGVRDFHSYPVGSFVWFIRHPQTPTLGTIIAAEPPWAASTVYQPADGIWPFTRSGQRVESSHRYPVETSSRLAAAAGMTGGIDVPDLSAGRPIDTTGVGEWGVMAETGVGLFADPFQAYLRVDEATGIFAFYTDQLLRVSGHNYQHRTSHLDHEELDDEGELVGFSRRWVYPWEAYGVRRPNQVSTGWNAASVDSHGLAPGQGTKFVDPFISQDGSGEAVREPEMVDQVPAARILEWFGYLGQGGRKTVAAPVQLDQLIDSPGTQDQAADADPALVADDNAPAGRLELEEGTGPLESALPYAVPPERRGLEAEQAGVLEVTHSLAGSFRVRSARDIILARRPSIPVPRQVLRPEDPDGDTTTDYRPSGWEKFGSGDAHQIATGLAASEGSPQRACMLPETLAYLFNWEGLAPFAYHTRDWYVAQEGAAGSDIVNQVAPTYADLATDQYLAAPTPEFLEIDHRYGDVKVYPNESHVALLEDGTIVIGDGWGSEIRMTGGNIEFHCPGDVSFFPGRNLLAWAGHDIVLRAHDSADFTAAKGDMRFKADRNLHALGGNSGCGGVMIESKSICAAHGYADRVGEQVTSSGIIMIAPQAQFSVLAGDVAIKLEDTSSDGRIYLDSGYSRHIHTRSRTFVNRVTPDGAVVHLFDGNGVEAQPSANEFAAGYTLLSRDLLLGEDLYVSGAASFERTVTARRSVSGNSSVSFATTRSAVTERKSYLVGEFRDAYGQEVVLPPHADEAEFTCRTAGQYLSTNYAFWEPRWRAIAAGASQTLTPWTEPEVLGLRSGVSTLPHPGARWTEPEGYRSYVFTLVDTVNGWVAVDRDANRGDYEAATVTSPINSGLADSYSVPVPAGTE